MEAAFGKFVYWFLTESLNSWVFRAVTLGLAIICAITAAYSSLEIYRSFKPDKYYDRLCNEVFLYWALSLEAFITFVSLLYILDIRLL